MNEQYFIKNYDLLMPRLCEPYQEFMETGASLISKSAKSVLDLGIGKGKFSIEVKKRLPSVKIYGIDLSKESLEIAKERIPGLETLLGDIRTQEFPEVDYIISSLATHHFPTETRKHDLSRIAKASKKFVNFDLAIFPGETFDTLINKCLGFSSQFFSKKKLKLIKEEMKKNDNPMPLEETVKLFSSGKFEFKIIKEKPPYVLYSVLNKER